MSSPIVPEIQDKEWKSPEEWLSQHREFLRLAEDKRIPLLFLGDSITQGWSGAGKKAWDAAFAPLGGVNFGIGGDEVQHVLWRVLNGEVDGLSPALVVLLIGTNNIGNAGHSGLDTAEGIKLLVNTLREKMPETAILLHKVFPRDQEAGTPFRREIAALNQSISSLKGEAGVTLIDVNHLFLEDDGTIAVSTMPDFLHLSMKSYHRWADVLLPEVRRLMS
ncbi:MAG: GDSL-type esterase/lipase family protein [Lentisphaeria bacterium]|nr:GDSL-type esterase/lipase family protein [Lentisphaeria bacterium]